MIIERLRAQIRAVEIVERLRAHAMGEIDLSPMQIRIAEILLRKVIPGFRAGWVLRRLRGSYLYWLITTRSEFGQERTARCRR
jgi:hypothetical protein